MNEPLDADMEGRVGALTIDIYEGRLSIAEALRTAAREAAAAENEACARACSGLVVAPNQPIAVLGIFMEAAGGCAAAIRARRLA